jgi:hypothetical protein
VTIGLATQDYSMRMLDKKIDLVTFSAVEASMYHLENFGTGRTQLKNWELKPEAGS